MQPLVTAIITTYNRPEQLAGAIKSVLSQTYTPIELIVVDDNSDQNLSEALAPYRKRVTYIKHDSNKGGSASRNTGIDAARGEYVAFLDDDDQWLPSKIEAQLRLSSSHEAVLCGYSRSSGSPRIERAPEILLSALCANRSFPTSSLLVKTEVARLLKFDESLPKAQDWDLLVRLAQRQPIGYVRQALLHMNDGEHLRITNWSRLRTIDELDERLIAFRKHQSLLRPYWFNYRRAWELLAYISSRPDRVRHVIRVAGRCGMIPTAHVFCQRLINKL